MAKLGISLYPDKAKESECYDYLELAHKYYFSKVFINYIGVEAKPAEVQERYKKVLNYAKKLGYDVILDVDPLTLKNRGLNLETMDLSYFVEIGATTLRLDGNFDGLTEARLSNNKYGLQIQLNASLMNETISNILSCGANPINLSTLHNFYPQEYSGLDYSLFYDYSSRWQGMGIKQGVFIALQKEKQTGPWDINENLPTLEIHRYLPLDLQIRHFQAMQLFDFIIISTQFASEEELKLVYDNNFNILTMKIKVDPKITQLEKEILFNHSHYVRGDLSSFIARSTVPRKTYANSIINPRQDPRKEFIIGDIVIPNATYKKYQGEVQIVLDTIENTSQRNYAASICDEEKILLEYINPWTSFQFIEDK